MPLLTVTNLLASQIQLQDTTGVSGFSESLAPGQTKEWAVTTATAEALEPSLIQSQALARITFKFAANAYSPSEIAGGASPAYTAATLPAADSVAAGTTAFVSDEGDNGVMKISNGTSWLNYEGALT